MEVEVSAGPAMPSLASCPSSIRMRPLPPPPSVWMLLLWFTTTCWGERDEEGVVLEVGR